MDVRPERRKMSVESIKTKSAIVDEIKAKLEGAESVVVIDYIGTTVEQATAMRAKLREADVDYTVYKNTMIARAVEGTAFEGIKDSLEGPSALAISKSDAVAPARVINSAIKEYGKMAFKAGYVEGILYDAEGLTQIANIPSRDELIAKFMGSIQSPVGKFVRTLAAIAEAKAE
jgi:large subunit ribosomal protein L10